MKKTIVIILSALLLLTACTSSSTEGLEKVSLILDYVPNTNHTGFYVAMEKGYFKELGLELDIIDMAASNTVSLIASGQGDFGIAYQEDVTYARAAENPLDIKAIATILYTNTSGFASFKDKNITSVEDLEGKKYLGWGSPSEEAMIKGIMEKAGADFEGVEIISADTIDVSMLKDEVDFIWLYWAWQGIQAQYQNLPLNYLPIIELDPRLESYTPLIISSGEMIQSNPDLCKRFLQAVRKGYEYAAANPVESAEILSKYIPEYELEFLIQSQEYISDYYISPTLGFGVMEEKVWRNYTDFMLEQGLIENDIDLSEAFTNEFLSEDEEE